MATIHTRVRTRAFVFLFALLSLISTFVFACYGTAEAQTQPANPSQPPPCESACPCVEKPFPLFDIGVHGLSFSVRTVVVKNCATFLLIYEPALRVAAMVDPRTGLAQVVWPFSAGVPDGEEGPIRFDAVQHLGGVTFLWWHRGAVWADAWQGGFIVDLTKFIVVDAKTRQRVALFRWR